MTDYDNGPRALSWPLLNPLVGSVTVEDEVDCDPSSFVWPDDPNERTLVPFYLSLNEYNVLGSTIDVGSDIAFGNDALRVVWLWMRNFRCNVPICDLVDACIEGNPATIAAIVAKLEVNTTFNTFLSETIVNVSPPASGNIYPPRPTAATPDPLCNAATYVVAKIRALFVAIYADLETLTPSEVLEGLLGVFGWRSGPLYQLIGLLETEDETSLLAAFDAAADDLICQLIEDELDQTAVLSWIAATYPPPSVIGDAFTQGIEAAADDGKYAQWIAVGATMTGATCDCSEPPAGDCANFIGSDGGFAPWLHPISGLAAATLTPDGWDTGYNSGFSVITLDPDAITRTSVTVKLAVPLSDALDVLVQVANKDQSGIVTSTTEDLTEYVFTGVSFAAGLYVNVQTANPWPSDQRIIEVCWTSE